MEAPDHRAVDLDGDELTPAQANAELHERGPELAAADNDDEIERLAAIADQGDPEEAERAMPDSEGWSEETRAEVIAGWRAGRRWIAKTAMRPGESGDEWRERCIAQMAAEHGCAPLVIPARRREDVLEVNLARVSRRDRRRLYRPGGHKSLDHARRHALRVLRIDRPAARRSPAPRRAANRPSRSSSSSRTSGADPGDGDDGEPAGVAAHACRRRIAGGRS